MFTNFPKNSVVIAFPQQFKYGTEKYCFLCNCANGKIAEMHAILFANENIARDFVSSFLKKNIDDEKLLQLFSAVTYMTYNDALDIMWKAFNTLSEESQELAGDFGPSDCFTLYKE